MSFGIKRFFTGIQIVPITSTQIDLAGEVEFTTSSNKFNAHNGTSASPLVTEDHAATLTNKFFLSPDGASGSPTYSFDSNPNTGMFNDGTDRLGFSTGGMRQFKLTNSLASFKNKIQFESDGSAAAPIITWETDTDTGIFRAGSNNLRITAGGNEAFRFSTTEFQSTLHIITPNIQTSDANPASTGFVRMVEGTGNGLYWRNHANNGDVYIYKDGADNFHLNARLEFDSGAIEGPGWIVFAGANSADNGAVRLNNNDTTNGSIAWRNAANSSNLFLIVDNSNNLNWNSSAAKISSGGALTATALVGTTTGSGPSAGNIGEKIDGNASSVATNTATSTTIISITLTTGVWNVGGTLVSDNDASQTGFNSFFEVEGGGTNTAAKDAIQVLYAAGSKGNATYVPRQVVIASGDSDKTVRMRAQSLTASGHCSGYLSAIRIA